MQSQIEISAELSERLSSLAQTEGITVDELLVRLLRTAERIPEPPGRSPEEFERDLDALAIDAEPNRPEYRGTYRREDIYLEHN